MCAYVAGTPLYGLFYLISKSLMSRNYLLYFTDEDTETQRLNEFPILRASKWKSHDPDSGSLIPEPAFLTFSNLCYADSEHYKHICFKHSHSGS